MKIDRVSVPFVESRKGLQELRFAASVAKLLKVPLTIVLPALRSGEVLRHEQLVVTEGRILPLAQTSGLKIEIHAMDLRSMSIAKNTIHVGGEISVPNVIHLRPFDEQYLNIKGCTIFIPFGKGGAGVRAARFGVALAKTLGMSVTFYHTTYRSDVASDRPEDHVCREAKEVQRLIEEVARTKAVPFTTIVETAPGVADGIVLSALLHNASLIVMTHGRQVMMGSYVDQVAVIGPIPLMILPKEVQ